MILGFLSDGHGNVEGYRKGLALLLVHGASEIAYLGDSVGYFAGTDIVNERMAVQDTTLMGNHEYMLLHAPASPDKEAVYRLDRVRSEVTDEQRTFLSSLPKRHERIVDGRLLILVHGSVASELTGSVYPDTPLAPLGTGLDTMVFMGHTHRPFIRRVGDTTYINVGSCGLPRDDGTLGSACLFDTLSGEARILRYPLVNEIEMAIARGPVSSAVLATLERREKTPFGEMYDDR